MRLLALFNECIGDYASIYHRTHWPQVRTGTNRPGVGNQLTIRMRVPKPERVGNES